MAVAIACLSSALSSSVLTEATAAAVTATGAAIEIGSKGLMRAEHQYREVSSHVAGNPMEERDATAAFLASDATDANVTGAEKKKKKGADATAGAGEEKKKKKGADATAGAGEGKKKTKGADATAGAGEEKKNKKGADAPAGAGEAGNATAEKPADKKEKKQTPEEPKPPAWKKPPAATGKNDTAEQAKLAAIPKNPREGKIKDGYCSSFLEGSSLREIGEKISFWGAKNHLTQEQCFTNCDNDGACEQAVYQANTEECWLGTNAMTEPPGPNKCKDCVNTCYAKNGFGHKLKLDVKDGWCSDFKEGWGGAKPQQCDLTAVMTERVPRCSHWGAEYGLSERGCWAKCQENPHCKQAVYENKNSSWSCFIGTGVSTKTLASRCSDCNNRCYARTGFRVAQAEEK